MGRRDWEIEIDIYIYIPLGIKLADFLRNGKKHSRIRNILGEEASIKGVRVVQLSGGDAAATTNACHSFCLTQLSLWMVTVSRFFHKGYGALRCLSASIEATATTGS